jgi:hypothetical protein
LTDGAFHCGGKLAKLLSLQYGWKRRCREELPSSRRGDPRRPDYFQLAPIVAEAYNTAQVVPIVGFKTGVVIRRRIEVGLNVQGVYGFKSCQDMLFDYSYKVKAQETAVFESKGTGVFAAFSIGYRF